MNYWITVSYGECNATSVPVATTADPALVRHVLAGLCRNRTLEDDHRDRVAGPEFYSLAQAAITALGETIRRDACHTWPDETLDEPADRTGSTGDAPGTPLPPPVSAEVTHFTPFGPVRHPKQ